MENSLLTHENGNVMNRSIINMSPFNTKYENEILIIVLLREEKSLGWIWSSGENSIGSYMGGRQISNRQEEVHKRGRLKI